MRAGFDGGHCCRLSEGVHASSILAIARENRRRRMIKIVWENKEESILKIRAIAGVVLVFFGGWFVPILLGKIFYIVYPEIGTPVMNYASFWILGIMVLIGGTIVVGVTRLVYDVVFAILKGKGLT